MIKDVNDFLSNQFVKIILTILFFLFIIKIFNSIGVFFGMEKVLINSYMFWIVCIILLYAFFPEKRSNILFYQGK